MAHLCVPQNHALGVCRGFVPDIQVRGTHGRKDLVNAAITSNAEEEVNRMIGHEKTGFDPRVLRSRGGRLPLGHQGGSRD